MSDETVAAGPAWIDKPWTATHKKTLLDERGFAHDNGNRLVVEAIDGALAEIARLEAALEAVAALARAYKRTK